MLYGLLNLSFWGYVAALFILTHITIVTVTVFLHRHQAHKALEMHPILSHFFRFWLWLTTGMVTRDWVAIHRKHHAKCETEEDPHSPQIKGLRKVLWEGAELYRAEARNQETIKRYGQGTPNDWLERHIYTPHSSKGIFLMLGIDLLLFGVPGITIWAFQMIWIPFFAAGVVNGIGHYWGYRNFECNDAARNIAPFGFLVGGEELHNNHHTYPTSAKLSAKWWEFDLGWMYIRSFQFLKLAKVRHLPPKVQHIENKTELDLHTLQAVLSNRFQILAAYSKRVILPTLQEEKRKAGTKAADMYKRTKKLLIRETSLIKQHEQQRLFNLLSKNEALNLIYQQRLKLQQLWSQHTANPKELLEALQEWCKQAEATGIQVLRDFVQQLKGYRLVN